MLYAALLLLVSQEDTPLLKQDKDVVSVVEQVSPSVVRVQADDRSFSGVIWTPEGHVVTDASGVEQAGELRVAIGGRVLPAERLDADRRTGIAVLKISASGLKPVRLGAEGCRSGSTVIVVGNAFGAPGSAAQGLVGAAGRSILVRGRKYENMLQMNVIVHPGDCGGFVSDAAGRFLGLVHSAGAAEGDDGKSAPAFAVPGAWVKFSADRIIRHGKMVRGWMGASLLPLGEAARRSLGLEEGVGAEVARVDPVSPARRAGLALRDIVVAFDGQPLKDLEALQWRIAKIEEPVKVRAEILRDKVRHEIEILLEIDPQK